MPPIAGPVFVVHHLDHVLAACRASSDTGRPVTLLTPPGGAHAAGPPYYREAVRAAKAVCPEAAVEIILDCGDDAALAVAALKTGWKTVVLSGSPTLRRKVAAIAQDFEARILARRPAAVDLLQTADPEAAYRDALGGD